MPQKGIEVCPRGENRRQRVVPAVGGVLPLKVTESHFSQRRRRPHVVGGFVFKQGAEDVTAGLGRVAVHTTAAAIFLQRSPQPFLQLPGTPFSAVVRFTSVT